MQCEIIGQLLNFMSVVCLDTLLPEEILSRGLGDISDAGGENFEQLFGRFSEMKGIFVYLLSQILPLPITISCSSC